MKKNIKEMLMEENNKKVKIEFTQEEIEDLLEELINVKNLLSKATNQDIKNLHKDESEDVKDMFVVMHKARIRFLEDMIDKLAPYSYFLSKEANKE